MEGGRDGGMEGGRVRWMPADLLWLSIYFS